MNSMELHKTQISILRSLRYTSAARFNALMKPTGHTSDTFKFHLYKLAKLGYVEKRDDGAYQLTTIGKEFANTLEEEQRTIRKQPTLSVFLVVTRPGDQGTQFLLFKRARNPFIGYWTCITDPVRWGELFEDRAAERLLKQTGLRAKFTLHSFHRVRNFADETNQLLEDMLFAIMISGPVSGELQNNYLGGSHEWLTLDELKCADYYYPSTVTILENLSVTIKFQTQDLIHKLKDY